MQIKLLAANLRRLDLFLMKNAGNAFHTGEIEHSSHIHSLMADSQMLGRLGFSCLPLADSG